MSQRYIKSLILLACGILFITIHGYSMVNINRETVNADLVVKYVKLEKEEAMQKDAMPLKSDFGDFNDPWIRKKIKSTIRGYSTERKVRIDFALNNVYFKNFSLDKDGKYEYKLFSVKWPIFSTEIINKKINKGMYQTHSYISSKNGQALVEGLGYYFLQNQLISDWYGDERQVKETYETETLIIKILDQKMTLASVLKSDKELPADKPYSVKGYCVYGGSLIVAARGWLWYPFDTYASKLFINFPFKNTDLKFSVEPSDDFNIKIKSTKEKELENFKLEENKNQFIEVLLRRKNYKLFWGLIASVLLFLLPTFFPKLGNIFLARIIIYLSALCTIFVTTIPPESILLFFPIRFIILSLVVILGLVNEYFYYIRNVLK